MVSSSVGLHSKEMAWSCHMDLQGHKQKQDGRLKTLQVAPESTSLQLTQN